MKKLSVLASAVALTASSLFGDIAVGKGLTVSGYLDFVYQDFSDDLAPATDASGFDTSVAEIDFAFDFGSGLSATVDLEGNVGSGDTVGAAGDPSVNIEQARIDYAFGDSAITLGKFDTAIGLEGLEAPDLYQYSNSLTWDQQFSQHTGIRYAYDNGMFNLSVDVVNSLNDEDTDSNDDLSYALHVGLTPSEAITLNANYAAGDEGLNGANETTYWSVDASWSDFGWTVGAEYVAKEIETAGATTSDVTGFMIMANYMFTEQFGLTARYSTTDDDVVGGSEDNEFTIAPSYAITPNWFVLAEYRVDEKEAGGVDTQDSDQITVETILTF